jgi:hypothetical protein
MRPPPSLPTTRLGLGGGLLEQSPPRTRCFVGRPVARPLALDREFPRLQAKLAADGPLLHPPLIARRAPLVGLALWRAHALRFKLDETAEGFQRARGDRRRRWPPNRGAVRWHVTDSSRAAMRGDRAF